MSIIELFVKMSNPHFFKFGMKYPSILLRIKRIDQEGFRPFEIAQGYKSVNLIIDSWIVVVIRFL